MSFIEEMSRKGNTVTGKQHETFEGGECSDRDSNLAP
jgi:hypothetical protein